MENQHKKITGYRDLSQAEIDLMNEVKDLEASGTKTKLVVVGMLPGRKTMSVVDPEIMEPAIKYGYERGMQDLPEMKRFWS